jgi:hypothetical protein
LEKTVIGKLATVWYYKSEGSCKAEEVECPIEYMLGGEDEEFKEIMKELLEDVLPLVRKAAE